MEGKSYLKMKTIKGNKSLELDMNDVKCRLFKFIFVRLLNMINNMVNKLYCFKDKSERIIDDNSLLLQFLIWANIKIKTSTIKQRPSLIHIILKGICEVL